MRRIDINVDVGEGAGHDHDLLVWATSANICCGTHAGDRETTLATLALCRNRGIRVGAHPGYDDRPHFGRRSLLDAPLGERDTMTGNLAAQVRLLSDAAVYLKPHGGLYNDSCKPGEAAGAVLALCTGFRLPLMGLPGTFHESIARAAKVGLIREGFADRRYTSEGLLVPRSEAGCIVTDMKEVADQVLLLAEKVDSICVHGDGALAVETVTVVRETLERAGYGVGW